MITTVTVSVESVIARAFRLRCIGVYGEGSTTQVVVSEGVAHHATTIEPADVAEDRFSDPNCCPAKTLKVSKRGTTGETSRFVKRFGATERLCRLPKSEICIY